MSPMIANPAPNRRSTVGFSPRNDDPIRSDRQSSTMRRPYGHAGSNPATRGGRGLGVGAFGDTAVLYRADAGDRGFDEVARHEAGQLVVQRGGRSRKDYIAGMQGHKGGDHRDELGDADEQISGRGSLHDAAIEPALHIEAERILELVEGHDRRPERAERVEAFAQRLE